MAESGQKALKPVVTATVEGVSVAVGHAEIVHGARQFPTATVVLSPGNGVSSMEFGELVAYLELATALVDASPEVKISMELDGKEISFTGFATSPGFSVEFGGRPGFRMSLAHNDSKLAELNLSIYSAIPLFNEESGGVVQNTIAIDGWYGAKDLGAKAQALTNSYLQRKLNRDFLDSLTKVVRDAVHEKNDGVVGLWLGFLSQITQSKADLGWISKMGIDTANLLVNLANSITTRTDNFITNLNMFCDMFGIVWYGLPVETDCLRAVSFLDLYETSQSRLSAELLHGPVRVMSSSESFATATGMPPTHILVDGRAQQRWSQDYNIPDRLLAKYPAEGLDGTSIMNRVPAPVWLPDGVSLEVSRIPGKEKLAAANVSTSSKIVKTVLEGRINVLSDLYGAWARMHYLRLKEFPKFLAVTTPLDLNIEACKRYMSGDEEASLGGIAWLVNHTVSGGRGGKAETSVHFRFAG